MNFIQQAYKGENQWYVYVLTLFVFLFGWQFFGVIPLLITAFHYAEDMQTFMISANNNFTTLGIDSNLYLILVIFTFLGGLIFLLWSIKKFHKRGILTVITSRKKIDWKRCFYAFRLWAIIGIVMLAISYQMAPNDFVWNFKPVPFFILLTISLFFLPIQTSMEEILFRGYLMQGFGLWFKKPFVALILTSAIFGLLHGVNPEVEKLGWFVMIYYIGNGFLMGIFTLMDEGTELALGFHAANNVLAALLVTSDWTVFQTDALFLDISEPSIGIEMYLPVFVLYPLITVLFARKYGWTNWKDKMFATIKEPIDLDENKYSA